MNKKLLLFYAIFFLVNKTAFSQVTFDNSSFSGAPGVSTRTWSHQTLGSDRLMIVGVSCISSRTVTSVTYNGVALTIQTSVLRNGMRTTFAWLANPSLGTNNVVVTLSGSADMYCGAVTYNGVNTGAPFGTFVTATGKSSTPSITVASAAGELAVDILGTIAANPTVGAGQTQRYETTGTSTYNSGSSEAGAASVIMSYTLSANEDWGIIGVSIKPLSALPIELLNFTAKLQNKKTHLKWSTASEINNDFFTVERSLDGLNFEYVTTEDGAGNSTMLRNYSAFDHTPYSGVSYYRLKQTDFDGTYTYSNLVEVEDEAGSNEFSFDLYPNPSDGDILNFNLTAEKGEEVLVVLYDVMGRETYSKVIITENDGNNTFGIDMEDRLASDIYLVTASSKNYNYSKKVVIR